MFTLSVNLGAVESVCNPFSSITADAWCEWYKHKSSHFKRKHSDTKIAVVPSVQCFNCNPGLYFDILLVAIVRVNML